MIPTAVRVGPTLLSRPPVRSARALPRASLLTLALLLSAPSAGAGQATPVPAPADLYGFEPGTDGMLASWDQIVEYLTRLGEASDRVVTEQVGESTEGRPFLLVTISSPENLARLDRLQEISRTLADPRGLDDAEVDLLVEEGTAVVAVTAGLHSTEVAPPQMTPVLAHRLATSDDAATERILDEVVFLLIPNFNPDGTQKVVEWVNETRDTEWEGSRYPDLYHHYSGHDNNRDAYALNQAESRHFAQIVYREWVPQMYLDVHQMGSYGPRLYVPPYDDPINPNPDPLLYMEHELVGANMRIALERAGITGVSGGTYYEGWWFPSFHMATNHHNIAGMLTETASANMAEPLYIHPDQLEGRGREMEIYFPIQRFPHPWPGGWWRLRDMMRQEEISTYALLETAAKNRELLLRNMAFKARRAVEEGRSDPPYAYVIRRMQHDPTAVEHLVRTLMRNGIDVHRATGDFEVDGRAFRTGDFVVDLAQPKGRLARSLLSEQHYPDNEVTREDDGTIVPGTPYDMAQFAYAEHWGVEAHAAGAPLEDGLELLAEPPHREGEVTGTAGAGWIASHRTNEVFHVLNDVLAEGGEAWMATEALEVDGERYQPGAVWIPAAAAEAAEVAEMARTLGVDFRAAAARPDVELRRVRSPRIALYRRYMGGNMDEGWTRFLFDHYGFDYTRTEADDVRGGVLDGMDVFVIPDDGLQALRGEGDPPPAGEGERDEYPESFVPPEYREGLDEGAIDAVEAWVRDGGTLVLMGEAWELAAEELGVPVRNVVADLPDTAFYSPGSTLRATFDTTHPLAWGMPEEAWVLNWDSPAFEIRPSEFNGRITAPVRYAEGDLLKSGWLLGGHRIAGRPAALVAEYGQGRIVMIGFRSQLRAQTGGTFKVFFNSLYPLDPPVRAADGG